MEKIAIIFTICILLLFGLITNGVSAGYFCDMCGGDGFYWYGGEKHSCFYCGGDGCIENPTSANAWKDDCSCGCDDEDDSSYSDVIQRLVDFWKEKHK